MRRFVVRVLPVIVMLLVPVTTAQAGVMVEVLETWPSGDAITLAPNQNFYMRLAYDTDRPVHIWARPFYQGKAVNAGSHPSAVYNGRGESLAWFFFMQPDTVVDEVRITVGDGSADNTSLVAIWNGRIASGRGNLQVKPEPGWVVDMRAAAQAAQEAAYQARMNEPVSAGATLFFGGFMLAMLALGIGGFVAPVWGLRRWTGGWRLAAVIPLLIMAFVVLRIMLGVLFDPTSHNLWPFEILQAGLISVGIMLLLWLARKFTAAVH